MALEISFEITVIRGIIPTAVPPLISLIFILLSLLILLFFINIPVIPRHVTRFWIFSNTNFIYFIVSRYVFINQAVWMSL